VREELGIEVMVHESYPEVTYSYPTFTVTLYPSRCTISAGKIVVHEHKKVIWMLPEELRGLDWADADWPIINTYLERHGKTSGL
jgi:8-oxo-dGTP diphosphatase